MLLSCISISITYIEQTLAYQKLKTKGLLATMCLLVKARLLMLYCKSKYVQSCKRLFNTFWKLLDYLLLLHVVDRLFLFQFIQVTWVVDSIYTTHWVNTDELYFDISVSLSNDIHSSNIRMLSTEDSTSIFCTPSIIFLSLSTDILFSPRH